MKKRNEIGWIGKACYGVGHGTRVTGWVHALCILRVFLCQYMYVAIHVKLYELLSWFIHFEKPLFLPALRSALLRKAQIDPLWSASKFTDARRIVGTI